MRTEFGNDKNSKSKRMEKDMDTNSIMIINNAGYEPSKYYMDFYVAGFKYWDGPKVIGKLKNESKLTLKSEPDNPYDPEAVAIYAGKKKIGYIPMARKGDISKLLYFGHGDIFKVMVSQINMGAHPEQQVRVIVRVKDKR